MLVLALGSVKLSFMFFYRRVFRTGDSKAFDRVMFSVVAIIVAWTASFFFALMFECGTQFHYIWTRFENRCVKGLKLQVGFAVSDFITDFIVLGFPLPFVSLMVPWSNPWLTNSRSGSYKCLHVAD